MSGAESPQVGGPHAKGGVLLRREDRDMGRGHVMWAPLPRAVMWPQGGQLPQEAGSAGPVGGAGPSRP